MRLASRPWAGLYALVCLLACAQQAKADAVDQSLPQSAVSLRGFGTLGVAHSRSDQAAFVRDLSQPDGIAGGWSAKIDSLIGVQGNVRVSGQIEGVAQIVSRYGSEGNYRPELMWAFARFDPDPGLCLRAGRLGTDFHMLADSRLVGYSYLPVRPPVDYFGTLPFPHIDGVDGIVTAPLGTGLLRGKLYAGLLDNKVPSLGRQFDLGGSRMAGGHVDYQSGNWLWRLGHARLRYENGVPADELLGILALGAARGLAGAATVADGLTVAGKFSKFDSAGVVYDQGPLQVQLMLSRIRQESAMFEDSRAGYLIAGYRLGGMTPYAGYSWARSTARQLPATGMDALVDAAVADLRARAHTDQHTGFVGVRWDLRATMAVKVQYDIVRGSAASVFPFQQVKDGWKGNTEVLSATLDFVF